MLQDKKALSREENEIVIEWVLWVSLRYHSPLHDNYLEDLAAHVDEHDGVAVAQDRYGYSSRGLDQRGAVRPHADREDRLDRSDVVACSRASRRLGRS